MRFLSLSAAMTCAGTSMRSTPSGSGRTTVLNETAGIAGETSATRRMSADGDRPVHAGILEPRCPVDHAAHPQDVSTGSRRPAYLELEPADLPGPDVCGRRRRDARRG